MGLLLSTGMWAHAIRTASPWVQRWSHLVPPGAPVLDVACGAGRHVRWFAKRGHPVTGIDRDAAALAGLSGVAQTLVADIERSPWPLAGQRYGAVLGTNYLWRPLMAQLVDSVADGGVFLWETFAAGNEAYGKPTNPDFLLRPGELLEVAKGLRVVAYEDGVLTAPERCVQRIVAVREGTGSPLAPCRYL